MRWYFVPGDERVEDGSAHGQQMGVEVEIVERDPSQSGFVPQAKRWVVERAYGILMLHRRLVRDYEHLPRSSESRVYWAMTAVILRRLTGAAVPAWRTA
ncbi:transposase [Streptomyces sp. NPDC054866]